MVLSVRNWDWLAFRLEAEVVDVEWVVKGALVDEDHCEYAYY